MLEADPEMTVGAILSAERPVLPAREPAPVPLKAGLNLRIDISPGHIKGTRNVPGIWETISEDFAEVLTKRLGLREDLNMKAGYQTSTGGYTTLTLSLTPDA